MDIKKPTSKFAVITNNFKAIILLRPPLATYLLLEKFLRVVLVTLVFALSAGLIFWLYVITISHISFDKVDFNLDGVYTFKDFLFGIFGVGIEVIIDTMNNFIDVNGEFWEITTKVEYTSANMFKAFLFYYLYFIPGNVFVGSLAIKLFYEGRLKADE
jgi:hypothetical protein